MGKAIGMIETNSIARGIEACDFMIKAARVELLRSTTVCPGKYIVLVGGETSEVSAAMEIGKEISGGYLVDSLLIPNVHEQVLTAVHGAVDVDPRGAVGVIEFYSLASAIQAADIAVKAAEITLIEVRVGYAVGGKGFVTLCGDVSAVNAAVEAAAAETELLVDTCVIPRPDSALLTQLL
ncbi:BMC domain-containing protein [Anaerotruncus rubiinfantis]|uniref:BMC domain-containing protein n=1 Tax=Anaerotruncus rubiinfantis TaxID=1720200 RepID=UPI00082AA2E3|nr:BMC domain-containing protein [Anaerotruncus rubiinfantis]